MPIKMEEEIELEGNELCRGVVWSRAGQEKTGEVKSRVWVWVWDKECVREKEGKCGVYEVVELLSAYYTHTNVGLSKRGWERERESRKR